MTTSEIIDVVIVDDELLARERLRRLLETESDMRIVGVCQNGNECIDTIVKSRPSLVFLDVQMPGRDGFGVIDALMQRIPGDAMPAIVFVTAHDTYAIRAFEARALDYLVKPFEDERFAETLDRARKQIKQGRLGALTSRLRDLLVNADGSDSSHQEATAPEDSGSRLDRIVVKSGNRAKIVRSEEIDWIAADGVYARLHFGGASALIRTPLHELETRLDTKRFVRIHRSTIVNLERVQELREVDRGEFNLVLTDGTRLKLSRSRRANLEAMLGQRL
jgi:two-component system LytT family response regulator